MNFWLMSSEVTEISIEILWEHIVTIKLHCLDICQIIAGMKVRITDLRCFIDDKVIDQS